VGAETRRLTNLDAEDDSTTSEEVRVDRVVLGDIRLGVVAMDGPTTSALIRWGGGVQHCGDDVVRVSASVLSDDSISKCEGG
jgi:hypothetical protein